MESLQKRLGQIAAAAVLLILCIEENQHSTVWGQSWRFQRTAARKHPSRPRSHTVKYTRRFSAYEPRTNGKPRSAEDEEAEEEAKQGEGKKE